MSIRPIFKSIHPAFVVSPGVIRLGDLPGTAMEMEDENGAILALVRLMDGTRTVEELWQELLAVEPSLTVEDVAAAVDELHSLGFLYTVDEEPRLSAHQRERFKGNLNFLTHYARFGTCPEFLQERLVQAQVTVLGMGAFGCSLLFQLAGLGVRRVRIVDFDTVGLSNLNRQMLFKEADLGRSKLEVAKEFMAGFYSDMEIETVTMEIRNEQDAAQVIVGSDLVVLAADQPFFILAHWVNTACVEAGIPLIGGGMALTHGTMFAVVPGQSGCLDCMLLRRAEMAEDYPEIIEQILDLNFIVPNSATAPNLQMITGMIGADIVRLITQTNPAASAGKVLMVNYEMLQVTVTAEFERRPHECPTCGDGRVEDHKVLQLMKRDAYTSRAVVER